MLIKILCHIDIKERKREREGKEFLKSLYSKSPKIKNYLNPFPASANKIL